MNSGICALVQLRNNINAGCDIAIELANLKASHRAVAATTAAPAHLLETQTAHITDAVNSSASTGDGGLVVVGGGVVDVTSKLSHVFTTPDKNYGNFSQSFGGVARCVHIGCELEQQCVLYFSHQFAHNI